MKSRIKKIALGLGAVTIMLGATVVFSEPGSEGDPLVTLSYVDKRIEQVKAYIDEKLLKGSNNDNTANNLEVVNLLQGQSIIGKAGTEMILRGGKAKVIAGELGGLSDVTDGKDLSMDNNVPANHLLIIPRDDGRGAYAAADAIFLIRGQYEIR